MKTLSPLTSSIAIAVLTSDNVNVTAGKKVVIGSNTYTFVASPSVEGDIDIGSDADGSLLNLIRAINHTGTPNTDYKCAAANTQVTADAAVTSHTITVRPITAGTLVTTTDEAHLSWATSPSVAGSLGNVIVACTVADQVFTQPGQQVTVGQFPSTNALWSRAIRITNEAVFCLRNGASPVAMLLDVLSQISVAMEPSLSWAPKVTTQPVDALATFAASVLTSNATIPTDGDQVVIGSKTYTFKTTLTPTEGEVLINGSAAAALVNLKAAINHTGTPDTDYKCAAAHTQVSAGAITATTLRVVSKTIGTAANSYATTTTGSPRLSWPGSTMTGGTAAPFFALVAVSEATAITYAWKESADGVTFGSALTTTGIYDVSTPGNLVITPVDTSKTGYYYKCVMTNASGSTDSDIVQLILT